MKTQVSRKGLTAAVGLGLGAAATYVLLTRAKGTSVSVEVHKTLDIEARVERVFDFWTDYENFPDWMAHVRAVHDLDGVRSHWTVTGPAGLSVEWDAVLTEVTPNKLICWRTLPTSHVKHEGTVRFSKNADGRAHVEVSLTYWPPAGSL
ncbi:MAG: SRPBCC family protein, partial [Chloroflexi bacterium]|nr:SRPBCC family protein [Chloroflexota bacterium]